MPNLAAIKVKSNAKYICQECGSTELIQAHHQIPGDHNSLLPLCAECHSQKHPNLPKALFFNKHNQPYWHNISASSLAKQLNVCPRTIIRNAKKLLIEQGQLSGLSKQVLVEKVTKEHRGHSFQFIIGNWIKKEV